MKQATYRFYHFFIGHLIFKFLSEKKKKKSKKYLFLFIECPILLPIIIVKHFISNSILREIARNCETNNYIYNRVEIPSHDNNWFRDIHRRN